MIGDNFYVVLALTSVENSPSIRESNSYIVSGARYKNDEKIFYCHSTLTS